VIFETSLLDSVDLFMKSVTRVIRGERQYPNALTLLEYLQQNPAPVRKLHCVVIRTRRGVSLRECNDLVRPNAQLAGPPDADIRQS
jgi:hypothetical protein